MNVLQSYLIILIEMSCFLIFSSSFYKPEFRFKKWTRVVYVFIMATLVLIVSDVFGQSPILKQILNIVILVTVSMIMEKKKFERAVIVSVLFIFLLLFADIITILIDSNVFKIDTNGSYSINVFVILLGKSVLLLLILIFKKCMSRRWLESVETTDVFFLMIFPIISIACILFTLKIEIAVKFQNEMQFVWIVMVSLIAMNILVIFFMDDLAEKAKLKREKLMFEMDVKKQQEMYESLEENVKQQRSISHEYRNNLLYIGGLLQKKEYDELSDYLKKLSDGNMAGEDVIDTNNPVVNIILNTKYYEAKRAGASFICKINDLAGITMMEGELILVLSNLLNNAIEAVEKCNGRKMIKLKTVIEDEKFIVSVKNTFDGNLRKDGERFLSTKRENNELHGIGIKNVIKVVEKYDGFYLFEPEGDEFSAIVIIPMDF